MRNCTSWSSAILTQRAGVLREAGAAPPPRTVKQKQKNNSHNTPPSKSGGAINGNQDESDNMNKLARIMMGTIATRRSRPRIFFFSSECIGIENPNCRQRKIEGTFTKN